jgi:hypothetical protein
MSSDIWTPHALKSEFRSYQGKVWRVVEAQNRNATIHLNRNLDDQARLEELIDGNKPNVPDSAQGKPYLLFTPFRYAPYPHASRFRNAGDKRGVYYASEHVETAMQEMLFYRALRYADVGFFPKTTDHKTAFAAEISTERALDLTTPPFAEFRDLWTDPIDYAKTLQFVDIARDAGAEAILYESVRDPDQRKNIAVLSLDALSLPTPEEHQSWSVHYTDEGLIAHCELPKLRLKLEPEQLLGDERTVGLIER